METVKQTAANLVHRLRGEETSPTRKDESSEKQQQRETSPSKERESSPTKQRSPSPSQRNISPTRKFAATSTEQLPNVPSYAAGSDLNAPVGGAYEHFAFRNLNKDPTVNLFNRLFNRETHTLLGRSGVKVSRICLGSMNFGKLDERFGDRQGQLDEGQAHEILDRFVELGGNCIDTANFFPWFGSTCGDSERIIGNWLAKRSDRERLVIITKMRLPTDPANVNAIGLSRTNVITSVEESLRRLQTNYINFLQIDGWDHTVHVKEVVRILDELLMSGKVRNIGVCDFKGWQLQRMIDTSKYLNKHNFTCFEGEYNLLSRGCEMEVVDVCLNHDLGFIAYSPFKYGFLAGSSEYQHGQQQTSVTPASSDEAASVPATATSPPLVSFESAMGEPFEIMKKNPCYRTLYNSIQSIANSHNIAMSQIALRWVLQKEFVSTVVIGVDNVKELEECMRVLTDFQLTEQEMIQLDQASLPYLPYPYLSIPTDIGRKLFMNTPGPIVYSQLNYLTQAITLNDRTFDFGYPEEYVQQQQQLVQPQYGMKHEKDIISSKQQYRLRGIREPSVQVPFVAGQQQQQQPILQREHQETLLQQQTPLQTTITESSKGEPEKEQYQYLVSQQHRQASPPRT